MLYSLYMIVLIHKIRAVKPKATQLDHPEKLLARLSIFINLSVNKINACRTGCLLKLGRPLQQDCANRHLQLC